MKTSTGAQSLENRIRQLVDPILTCLTEWYEHDTLRKADAGDAVVIAVHLQRKGGYSRSVSRIIIAFGNEAKTPSLQKEVTKALTKFKKNGVKAPGIFHKYRRADGGWHVYVAVRGLNNDDSNKLVARMVLDFTGLEISGDLYDVAPPTLVAIAG